MKQLLAVSWAMPPLLFPRSLQVSRTLKVLGECGWHATALSVNPDSVRRAAVVDAQLEALYAPYFTSVRVDSPEEMLSLRIARRAIPVLGQLPDPQRVWVRRAVAAGERLLATGAYGAIISFAQPWSDHLIGLALHGASGLPWIAHFSDPWVDNPYLHPMRWVHAMWRRMERAIVAEADAVVFVSAETADLVMQKYPTAWRDKAHIVPHGYDASLLKSVATPPRADGPLRLVYTGNFYGDRGPAALLEAVALLKQSIPVEERVHVVFAGATVDAYRPAAERLGLGGAVEFLGPLSFVDSLAVAAAADVLLLIDAPHSTSSVFLPSKLVDYLMFKKTILGITPLTGASARLLGRLGCPVVAPDDVPRIAQCIAELVARRHSGTDARWCQSVVEQYDSKHTTQVLRAVLERCVTTRERMHR